MSESGNPAASVYFALDAKAHEAVYEAWLYEQLSRMPYLRKGLVRELICGMLVPELSKTTDAVTVDMYLAGWARGYERGVKDGLRGVPVSDAPKEET